LFGVLAFADAAGKCPEVPTQFDVPLLGLPGQLGVPSDDRPAKSVRFQVHADRPARPFPRYWDSLNSTWSDEAFVARTYARGYVSKMRGGVSLGSMVSFEDGFLRTDFTRLDRFLDFIRKYRVQMVVNLSGGGPRGIEYKTQAGTGYSRGRNVPGPPAYREDYKLVHQAYLELFQYILDREGRDFFDSLRFELWNEPDGTDRFFAGTVDDYCELYDWVAKALKDVSATGKIGGPAVTGGGYTFTRDFLNHCRDGANAATGGRGAPVDFVSFHVYGWRWQLTPSALAEAVNTIVHFWKIISDAGFGGVEVNITEWGIEPTGEAYGPYFWFRTNHYAPVWMAKFIKDIEDAKATYADLKPRVDSLSLCNFAMNNPEPFAGQRTLFTGKWIPKPYFNSYIVLNELGNERLEVTGIDSGPIGCIATKRPDGSLAILVFHFREYAKTSPPEEDIAVELAGLSLAGKKVFQMRVDKNTSNSHTAWVEMGSPRELTDEITEKLKAAAVVEKTPLDSAGGVIKLNMPVTSVAVVLIEDGK
jgi:xylan 1,4-beta-xylosidase